HRRAQSLGVPSLVVEVSRAEDVPVEIGGEVGLGVQMTRPDARNRHELEQCPVAGQQADEYRDLCAWTGDQRHQGNRQVAERDSLQHSRDAQGGETVEARERVQSNAESEKQE